MTSEKASNTEVHCQFSSVISYSKFLLLTIVDDLVQYDDGNISAMTGIIYIICGRTNFTAKDVNGKSILSPLTNDVIQALTFLQFLQISILIPCPFEVIYKCGDCDKFKSVLFCKRCAIVSSRHESILVSH